MRNIEKDPREKMSGLSISRQGAKRTLPPRENAIFMSPPPRVQDRAARG